MNIAHNHIQSSYREIIIKEKLGDFKAMRYFQINQDKLLKYWNKKDFRKMCLLR